MEKILHFKTNALLKNLVGKDLINNDNIAIVELVKNGFDAGSSKVTIEFCNFLNGKKSDENSILLISDEGSGMNLIDIQDKWLNIAYSEKTTIPQTKGNYIAGNKGIGRFSCDRLGEELTLLTKKMGEPFLRLDISWRLFENGGDKDSIIQGIDLIVKQISDNEAIELTGSNAIPLSGTTLIISKLRSIWDRDRLTELKIALEKFINPNQLFSREEFKIFLQVPKGIDEESNNRSGEQLSGEIKNQVFSRLKFNATYIESIISDDGSKITHNLFHEGEKVFDLIEKNSEYPMLHGTYIIIYYLNPYKKAYFKRQTGYRSVDFGSIFLFLNGFRIPPYGDRSDDWLGLDVRKTQGTARYLSSRDIVGRIEITGNEYDFKPISSREGLKITPAFRQLKSELFYDVLRKLEKFVIEGLQWDSVRKDYQSDLRNPDGLDWENNPEQYLESWDRKRQRIGLSILSYIGTSPDNTIRFWFNPNLLEGLYETKQEEINHLLKEVENYPEGKIDSSTIQNINKIRSVINQKDRLIISAQTDSINLRAEIVEMDKKVTILEQIKDTYQAQTMFLQQITTLDTKQLLSFHHQIIIDSTSMSNYLGRIFKLAKELPENSELVGIVEKTIYLNKRILNIAEFATKANFRSGIKKTETDLPAYIEQYIFSVAKEYIASNLKIEIINDVHRPIILPVSRIDMNIVIDNIITNANKARSNKLKLHIFVTPNNTLRISFIDDGIGLSPQLSSADKMFEFGITTTQGSGIGLYQVRKIISEIDGKVSALPQNPRGMEIRVEIPL
jgi:signal transduction histidine kinase